MKLKKFVAVSDEDCTVITSDDITEFKALMHQAMQNYHPDELGPEFSRAVTAWAGTTIILTGASGISGGQTMDTWYIFPRAQYRAARKLSENAFTLEDMQPFTFIHWASVEG